MFVVILTPNKKGEINVSLPTHIIFSCTMSVVLTHHIFSKYLTFASTKLENIFITCITFPFYC